MKFIFKKLLAVVLTFVMLLSVIGVTAFASEETNDYPPITLNQQQVANIETKGEEKFFVFTPEKSGGYIFESFAEEPKDTFGVVYNSNMGRIYSDDDTGIDDNFRIIAKLTAGETYYFSVKFYDENLGELPFRVLMIETSNIELKKEVEVEITSPGQEVFFEFTPEVTGLYILKSISTKDTYASVYNSNFTEIAYGDDSKTDHNFFIEITLEAGETYYFGTHFYKTELLASFTVLLTMFESPFESIEIKPATLTEGIDGYYNEYWDSTSGEKVKYFEYDWPNYIAYTIKLRDGKDLSGEGYSFVYQNTSYSFKFTDTQTRDNPWKPDNTYRVTISLEELSDEMEISIVHNYQAADCTTPKKCIACGETVSEALGHSYDNDCDTTCNVCGDVRTITHDFRWVIDEMNNCGKEGKQHQLCSVCGIVQNENTVIPATNSHAYANDCDTDCDVCGFVREVDNHMYNSVVDKTCDICGAEREVIGQYLIEEGDEIYYYVDGEKTDITSLVKINGKWHYIKDGKFAQDATTLVKYNGKWYYVKNGLKNTATTLVKYNGKWYYVEKGVKSTKTTLVKYNGIWYYVKDGKKNTSTTLVKYNGVWYYVKSGKKSSSTTLVNYNGVWYYVKSGKKSTATTLCKYNGKYYYVKSGKKSTSTAIVKYNGKKYYVKKGIAQTGFSGKVKISGKKYTVKKGIIK